MGVGLAAAVRWTLRDLRDARRLAPLARPVRRAAKEAQFPRLVAERAQATPERIFLRFEERTVTFGAYAAGADRYAHVLREAGVGRGEPVAIMMHNSPEMLMAQAAAAKRGAIGALLNTHLRGAPLAHALRASGARHLLADPEFLPAILERPDGDPGEGERPGGSGVRVWAGGDPAALPAGVEPLRAALDAAPAAEVSPPPLSGAEVFLYVFTSGTTGVPKPARVTYRTHAAGGIFFRHLLGVGPDDCIYAPLPLYHGWSNITGFATALAAGAAFASRRAFSASGFMEDVRRHGVSVVAYIGELCRYLLATPPRLEDRDHRIRVAVGAGLRPEIWEAFRERFGIPRIVEAYGESEGSVALMNLDGVPGSVGRPPPFEWRNVRLVRFDVDRGEPVRGPEGLLVECAAGEPGLLVGRLGRGSRTDAGYVHEQDMRERVIRDAFKRGDRWYRSSDLLRRDRAGNFFFVDRVGDTFRWKGENVATHEVEEILCRRRGIAEAAVYGVAVPGSDGRVGMAALVLEPGAAFDPEGLFAHADAHLPPYARPAFVRLVSAVEVTGTLKPRKARIREEGFDPAACGPDPLYVRDEAAGTYAPLSDEARKRLQEGDLRL